MKRNFLFLLILMLLFTVACSNSNAEPESFSANLLDLSDEDIDLHEFTMDLEFHSEFNDGNGAIFGYKSETVFYDRAMAKIADIEKKYNCHIHENETGMGLSSDFTPILMSGQKYKDAIMIGWYDLRPYTESGVFEPINEVSDVIDYTDSVKWGSPHLLEWVVWNGNLLGVTPILWPEFYISSFGYVFVFDEQYAKRLGQPDPREYVESDTWDRAQLGNMMNAYTVVDGEKVLKALCTCPNHFVDQALHSNNALAYKIVNGEYVSGYHTDEGQEALEWANDFLNISYKDNLDPFGNDTTTLESIIDGRSAMILTYTVYIYGSRARLSFELDEYCVLPFPNGPERKGQGYTGKFDCVKNTLMFPRNGTDLTTSAFICNELFGQLGEYDHDNLKAFYLKNYFYDERDYDTFHEIAGNTRFSYYSDGFRTRITDAIAAKNCSVTELLQKSKDKHNELVQKYVVPTHSYLHDLFGDFED